MDRRNIIIWLNRYYPTTIIYDRFGGIYSEGKWLAFPLEHYNVPPEVDGGDVVSSVFWNYYSEPVGKGSSPEQPFANLKEIISNLITED